MPVVIQKFIGALVAFSLAGTVGYLVAKGVITGDLGKELIEAAVIAVPTLIWRLYQKYKDHLKFLTALDLPAGSTSADVDRAIKSQMSNVSVLEDK